ncbi:MAG: glycosyltransferase family 39 protein [Caldilineales bacterium]|nr:glycosyltransferase family 39 protein [Caldilineales bacterium]MDW8316610.1 glycosyltransferase family 39 protein [Anaerolineae bacterium]
MRLSLSGPPFAFSLTAVIIGLLAVASRGVWALQSRAVRWDEPNMLLLARNWLRGLGYHIAPGVPDLQWPPGAPALAALSLAAGVPIEQALAVWHALLGAVMCVALYLLVAEVTGDRRVAATTGLLAAVWPSLAVWPLYWGSNTEAPFLAFWLLGLWGAWRGLACQSGWAALAAGAAFGAAYLVRPEGLLWWALFTVAAIALLLRRQQRWWIPVVAALGFWALAGPYVLYLSLHVGSLTLSGKTGITHLISAADAAHGAAVGQDAGSALDSSGQEILWDSKERFRYSLWDAVSEQPTAFVRRVLGNLREAAAVVVDPLLGVPAVVLAALGLFGQGWDRRRWLANAFWLAALAPLAVVLLFHIQPRLLAPLAPVALAWTAAGVWHLNRWSWDSLAPWPRFRRAAPLAAPLALAALLALGLYGQVQAHRAGQASLFPSHREAGLWLAEHSRPGEPVMSRNAEVSLYADRPPVALPNAGWEQVLNYGRRRGAVYLVLDSWEAANVRPQLAFLLDPARRPPEVEHLASFHDHRRTTHVFRLGDPRAVSGVR